MRLFSDVASRVSDPFLRHAVTLAERAQGVTAPNPTVGAVVVRDGRVVGEGYHPRAGEAHAEVFALADAAGMTAGADVYVTLEPCKHHGRTPPCTDALIAAGVRRVVIGMPDPSAEAGGGAEVLRSAGIDVVFAENPAPFLELNEGWVKRTRTGLPFVTAKVGLSLDARVSLAPGSRSAITGASGAQVTRSLRSRVDAVAVGAGTLTIDDPALTVRDAAGALAERQPLRVVIARTSAPHADTRVLSDGAAPSLVLAADTTSLGPIPADVMVSRYDATEGLHGALRELGRRGVNHVLVEPGPRLLSALWNEQVLDEIVTVTAGGMAGPDAPPLFLGKPDREGESLMHRMSPVEAGVVGDVSVTIWRRASDAEAQQSKGT